MAFVGSFGRSPTVVRAGSAFPLIQTSAPLGRSLRGQTRARWHCVAAPEARTATPNMDTIGATDPDQLFWGATMSVERMSKTVCTIGPKTASEEWIEKLAAIGMNVVRMNMSHGTHEWHQGVINIVRKVNAKGVYNLGLLLDTKGPEVRSGDLKEPIQVDRGMEFIWTVAKDTSSLEGKLYTSVSYDDFIMDIQVGDTLLVDGGVSSFYVTAIEGQNVISECIDGGLLTSRRHLNVRGRSASLPAITDKDWEDIKFGIDNNVDFYALSFVKHEDDVRALKEHMVSKNVEALLLAKIESADAVPRLQQILEASDGAMVARGDLGAEIPVEDVPLVQEQIVRINQSLKKPTIVATHMLESMITYPTPTRAEVTDITEAVKQGADATMLSGETAGGAYPKEALTVMCTVAQSVFSQKKSDNDGTFYEQVTSPSHEEAAPPRSDMSLSAVTLARDVGASALIVFTRMGSYARELSACRPRCPIFAFCPDEDLTRRLTLFWGVKSYVIDFSDEPETTVGTAFQLLREKDLIASGDIAVIVSDILVEDDVSVNSIQVRTTR